MSKIRAHRLKELDSIPTALAIQKRDVVVAISSAIIRFALDMPETHTSSTLIEAHRRPIMDVFKSKLTVTRLLFASGGTTLIALAGDRVSLLHVKTLDIIQTAASTFKNVVDVCVTKDGRVCVSHGKELSFFCLSDLHEPYQEITLPAKPSKIEWLGDDAVAIALPSSYILLDPVSGNHRDLYSSVPSASPRAVIALPSNEIVLTVSATQAVVLDQMGNLTRMAITFTHPVLTHGIAAAFPLIVSANKTGTCEMFHMFETSLTSVNIPRSDRILTAADFHTLLISTDKVLLALHTGDDKYEIHRAWLNRLSSRFDTSEDAAPGDVNAIKHLQQYIAENMARDRSHPIGAMVHDSAVTFSTHYESLDSPFTTSDSGEETNGERPVASPIGRPLSMSQHVQHMFNQVKTVPYWQAVNAVLTLAGQRTGKASSSHRKSVPGSIPKPPSSDAEQFELQRFCATDGRVSSSEGDAARTTGSGTDTDLGMDSGNNDPDTNKDRVDHAEHNPPTQTGAIESQEVAQAKQQVHTEHVPSETASSSDTAVESAPPPTRTDPGDEFKLPQSRARAHSSHASSISSTTPPVHTDQHPASLPTASSDSPSLTTHNISHSESHDSLRSQTSSGPVTPSLPSNIGKERVRRIHIENGAEQVGMAVKEIRAACGRIHQTLTFLFPVLELPVMSRAALCCVQEEILQRVAPTLTLLYEAKNYEADARLGGLQSFQEVKLEHFNVADTFDIGLDAYQRIIDLIEKIHDLRLPSGKIACVRRAVGGVWGCVVDYCESKGTDPPKFMGADELIPIFCYLLANANAPNLHADLEFMLDFVDDSMLMGETGYSLATLQMALSILHTEAGAEEEDGSPVAGPESAETSVDVSDTVEQASTQSTASAPASGWGWQLRTQQIGSRLAALAKQINATSIFSTPTALSEDALEKHLEVSYREACGLTGSEKMIDYFQATNAMEAEDARGIAIVFTTHVCFFRPIDSEAEKIVIPIGVISEVRKGGMDETMGRVTIVLSNPEAVSYCSGKGFREIVLIVQRHQVFVDTLVRTAAKSGVTIESLQRMPVSPSTTRSPTVAVSN